jgi:DNA-binding transcriptional MerR regulator
MITVRRYDIVLCRNERQQLTLDELASCAGMAPALVESLIEFGLIDPIESGGARWLFDPSAMPRLRTIRRLRESLGMNLAGIAVTLDLLDRLCALKRENEKLRSRL